MGRIDDKVKELEEYLSELSEIVPNNFEEYRGDFKIRAACERYFERIVESAVDLAFLIIKEYKLKIPEEDKQSFDVLEQEQIISKELSEKLRDAKGMRNILAHEYGRIDDEIVFDSIKIELIEDIEKFLEQIKNFLENKK